jgi:diguanylate cyclase (GGDEF)-like protein
MTTSSTLATLRSDFESMSRSTRNSLRFVPSLEFQFVFSKVSLSLQVLRASSGFALALYPAFLAYDALTTQSYISHWSVLLSFLLSTVSSLLILLATYKPGLYRFLPQLVPVSLGLNALALIACVVNLQRSGVYFPYEILVLNQLYAYFLCGLLFRIAVPLAAFTCMAWWAAGLWVTDLHSFVTHGLVLLTITLLGAVTCYFNEKIERRAWFQSRQIARVSVRDETTGLYNARFLREHGSKLMQQARREQVPVSALVVGIDNLELQKHLQGEAAGETILKAVARLVTEAGRRPIDLAVKMDDDRFALMLYGCDGLNAYTIGQRLHANINAIEPDAAQAPALPLKVSIGVAYSTPLQPLSIEQLTDSASLALGKARGHSASPIYLI